MMEAPKMPGPQPPIRVPIANTLAWGFFGPPVHPRHSNHPELYRLQRGRPFQRAGSLVKAIPQFKALTIYSPVSSNSPTGKFQTTVLPVAIKYPSATT